MLQAIVKFVVTAAVVVAVSELGKRSALFGAMLAALPLTSYLAFVWLYAETKDSEKVAALSVDIFWLVAVSLPFFLLLPVLLRRGVSFAPAMAASTAVLLGVYLGASWGLAKLKPAAEAEAEATAQAEPPTAGAVPSTDAEPDRLDPRGGG
jgi:hypothetical protein